jgi:transposase InsO family protein
MDELLQEIWYSTQGAAAFGSIEQLFRAARKKNPGISKPQVEAWLQRQDAYTLFQGRNRPIRRRRYFSPMAFAMVEADLLFLPAPTSNFGAVGALALIDIFSRFAFVSVIKSKSARVVAGKLVQIFDDPRLASTVQSFRTDLGKEFDNGTVDGVCKQRGIQQYFANPNNKTKCAIVERFNRT